VGIGWGWRQLRFIHTGTGDLTPNHKAGKLSSLGKRVWKGKLLQKMSATHVGADF